MRFRTSSLSRAVGCIALLSGLVAVAQASPASAAPGGAWNIIVFDKNTNDNSEIRLYTQSAGLWHAARSGSGTGTNSCTTNVGWLPNGTYDIAKGNLNYGNGTKSYVGHVDNYNGGLIFGRVYHLEDKACTSGTWRTELFIHTEESPTNTQVNCGAGGDSNQCWEGNGDYFSNACIKVARGPAGATTAVKLHNWFHTEVGGSNSTHYNAVVSVIS
jgi:hypothetical protein